MRFVLESSVMGSHDRFDHAAERTVACSMPLEHSKYLRHANMNKHGVSWCFLVPFPIVFRKSAQLCTPSIWRNWTVWNIRTSDVTTVITVHHGFAAKRERKLRCVNTSSICDLAPASRRAKLCKICRKYLYSFLKYPFKKGLYQSRIRSKIDLYLQLFKVNNDSESYVSLTLNFRLVDYEYQSRNNHITFRRNFVHWNLPCPTNLNQ